MKGRTLFEPVLMGDLELKNRIVMAPMTRGRAGEKRIPNELMAEYYFQRASAGLMITEATVISEQGIGWMGSPGIYTDEMAEGWKKVTQKVSSMGSFLFLQLWHCGRASHSDFHGGELPVSASAVKINGDGIHTSKGKKNMRSPGPWLRMRSRLLSGITGRRLKRQEQPGFQVWRSMGPTAISSISSWIQKPISGRMPMAAALRTGSGF